MQQNEVHRLSYNYSKLKKQLDGFGNATRLNLYTSKNSYMHQKTSISYKKCFPDKTVFNSNILKTGHNSFKYILNRNNLTYTYIYIFLPFMSFLILNYVKAFSSM